MKKIQNDYADVLNKTERCRFFGNVWVGKNNGIPLQLLQQKYSAVVLAYGATSERKLGLPGEDNLNGILSSRRIVNWYNGSLDNNLDYEKELNLEHVRDAAIVGNGNVSMDISRVLLKDPSLMAPYDIPTGVLEHLKKSSIKNLSIIGRRGVIQSAFSIKEIREISRIQNLQMYVFREEFDASINDASSVEIGAGFSPYSRGWYRRTEFLRETCKIVENEEHF